MKTTLFTLVLALVCHFSFAQSLCDPASSTRQSEEARAVDLFNRLNEKLGRKVKLAVESTSEGKVYSLNGKTVPSPFFDMQGKYKDWEHQMENHGNNLLLEYMKGGGLRAYVPTKKGKGEIISFGAIARKRDKTIDIFQTQNQVLNGKFTRKNCAGQLEVEGHYQTIDTAYSVFSTRINPSTYEQETVETKMDRLTIRTGKWNYYDLAGSLILEENYPGTASGKLNEVYRCGLADEMREAARNIYPTFLTFNAVSQQLDLAYWIGTEAILNNKVYYFNGQPIDGTKINEKGNRITEATLETPDAVLQLTTSGNASSGALGGKKRKLKLNVVIDHREGPQEIINLQNEVLKRYYRQNSQKIGPYEERDCTGELLVKGQYCQIDTLYRDTVSTINVDTYEEMVKITEYKVREKKSGTWRFFDPTGKLIKEEEHGNCKN